MQPLITLKTILDEFCMLCLPKNVVSAVRLFPEEEKLIIFAFSIKIENPETDVCRAGAKRKFANENGRRRVA